MHLHEEKRVFTGEADELICECLKVERQEIEEAIETIDAITVSQVRRECAAGGGCGSCHEEIARLILIRAFGIPLDFGNQLGHLHDESSHTLPAVMVDTQLADEIGVFLEQTVNPYLATLEVSAQIREIGEEVVLELVGADAELKYTLSFWLDHEFDQRFHTNITIIIA